MKKHFKKIIHTPKIAISIAIFIALILGVVSFVANNNIQKARFAKLGEFSDFTGANNINVLSKDLTLAFPVGGRIKDVFIKVGDKVKAGTVLASLDSENAIGSVNQAKASYDSAQISYTKLVNGVSTPEVDVAKVALNNAKNNYNNTVAQQKVLVANAFSAMLNSGLVALPTINTVSSTDVAPLISGTYTGAEGAYTITIYTTGNGGYFSFSGLEEGTGQVSAVPVKLGTRGLYIQFPDNFMQNTNTTWVISIPNTKSVGYLVLYNAYQSALQNQSQAVTTAQGIVDTTQALLDQKLSSARSEDLEIARAQVENTKGALQVAQGVYDNTIITAPIDGVIANVSITAGQIATANTSAIELLAQ
ncbi:MAG: biotin/lipoyl-binding protein [Patescibacteria group bacterium]